MFQAAFIRFGFNHSKVAEKEEHRCIWGGGDLLLHVTTLDGI